LVSWENASTAVTVAPVGSGGVAAVPPRDGLLVIRLFDPSGRPVDGVVHLRYLAPLAAPAGATWRVPEPGSGRDLKAAAGYAQAALYPGKVTGTVESPGWAPVTFEDDLAPGATLSLRLQLAPGDGAPVLTAGGRPAPALRPGDRLPLAAPVRFAYTEAAPLPESEATLGDVARTILAHPEFGVVRVEGHTDDTGTDLANLSLSQERADAVVAWLVRAGVPAERLRPVGYGSSRPVNVSHSDSARAQNRRVEFVIVGP
jgi:outer membrane protein OmpA-like peptidoglycan-associated protein